MKYYDVETFQDLENYLKDIFDDEIESSGFCLADERPSDIILEKVKGKILNLLKPYQDAVKIIQKAAEGKI